MECQKIEDLLVSYIENKLKPDDKLEVEKHLQQCKNCSKLLEEFKSTINLLKSLDSKEIPADFHRNTKLKLDGALTVLNSSKSPFLTPRVYIPAICILLLIVAITYFSLNRRISTSLIQVEPMETAKEQIITPGSKEEISQEAVKIAKSETKKVSERVSPDKTIEIKKTIEIAKLSPEQKETAVIFRGAGPKHITKRIIKQWQDTYSGIKSKKSLIVRDKQEWRKIWKKHTQNMSPALPVPEIDFSKHMVIAVFMGEKGTGGYGVHISEVIESENNIYIELEETIPASGAIVTQQLTQPYHIVVVNKNS